MAGLVWVGHRLLVLLLVQLESGRPYLAGLDQLARRRAYSLWRIHSRMVRRRLGTNIYPGERRAIYLAACPGQTALGFAAGADCGSRIAVARHCNLVPPKARCERSDQHS